MDVMIHAGLLIQLDGYTTQMQILQRGHLENQSPDGKMV